MSVDELKEEAFRLSPEARAYLTQELLVNSEAMSLAETKMRWINEAIRQDEDLDDKAVRAFSADESLTRAWAWRN